MYIYIYIYLSLSLSLYIYIYIYLHVERKTEREREREREGEREREKEVAPADGGGRDPPCTPEAVSHCATCPTAPHHTRPSDTMERRSQANATMSYTSRGLGTGQNNKREL